MTNIRTSLLAGVAILIFFISSILLISSTNAQNISISNNDVIALQGTTAPLYRVNTATYTATPITSWSGAVKYLPQSIFSVFVPSTTSIVRGPTTSTTNTQTRQPQRVSPLRFTPQRNSIIVSWAHITGATSYRVQYCSTSCTHNLNWITSTASTINTSHRITNLRSNTYYRIRVIATFTQPTPPPVEQPTSQEQTSTPDTRTQTSYHPNGRVRSIISYYPDADGGGARRWEEYRSNGNREWTAYYDTNGKTTRIDRFDINGNLISPQTQTCTRWTNTCPSTSATGTLQNGLCRGGSITSAHIRTIQRNCQTSYPQVYCTDDREALQDAKQERIEDYLIKTTCYRSGGTKSKVVYHLWHPTKMEWVHSLTKFYNRDGTEQEQPQN